MDLNKEIEILHTDDEVIVINKPAGLLVHPDGSSTEPTLVDWISENYPETKGVGELQKIKNNQIIERPGIVHRLDQDTSGAMIIARNQESFLHLKSQFQNQEIKKAYLAIVHGNFKNDESSTIDKPIGRSPQDFRRFSAQPGARGKLREAKTIYHVLEQVKDHSLLFLEPKTGRTHQLRVHLKAIHHPIVADKLYAPKKPAPNTINRQALHARAITWTAKNGNLQQAIAPVPQDLKETLKKLDFKYQP